MCWTFASHRRLESNETHPARLGIPAVRSSLRGSGDRRHAPCDRVLQFGGIAAAEPGSSDTIGTLVAAVANSNQKLQELGAAVQTQQESVNKAIVDLETARDNAAAAQREVDASRRAVDDSNAAIQSAQQRFDTFASSTYVNGPSSSYLTAADPSDILNTASVGQTLAASAQQVVANLQRARTEQINKESAARLAKQKSDQAAVDAQASQDAAVSALTSAQQTFRDQQGELDQLTAERRPRRPSSPRPARGPHRRAVSRNPLHPSRTRPRTGIAQPRHPRRPPAIGMSRLWDPTLPAIPSAFVSGDPIAIINTILGISSTSAQYTADMGRNFLRKMGLLPTPTGYTQRRDSPRLRQAGLRVRHPARGVSDRRAVLVGRR